MSHVESESLLVVGRHSSSPAGGQFVSTPPQHSLHLGRVGRQATKSVSPAHHGPWRHALQQVVTPEEEVRQVPHTEAGGQFAEQVAERGHDRVTLPARSDVDHRVEGVKYRGPDKVGAEPRQRGFHPHQSLEDAVSLAPGSAVTSIHLVEDARLSLDGGQTPEDVGGCVEVVSVGTSDDVGDITGPTANGTGRNQVDS